MKVAILKVLYQIIYWVDTRMHRVIGDHGWWLPCAIETALYRVLEEDFGQLKWLSDFQYFDDAAPRK